MSATFDTNLWGTNTPGTWLTCLAFTFPPASSGSYSFSVSLPDEVHVASFTIPDGMVWESNMLIIPSTFTTPNSRVILNLSTGSSASLSIFLSGDPQEGTVSSLQIDANGWMTVESAGEGVTFLGFTPLIQSIAEGGSVRLQDVVFLIPTVAQGEPDFSFTVDLSPDVLESLVSSNDGVSISGNVATAQSSLVPGDTATVTVKFELLDGLQGTLAFTIQRLSNAPASSGGESALSPQREGGFAFHVKSLASRAHLRGSNIQYLVGGKTDLMFHIATGNFSYASPPVSFSNTFSSSSTTFTFSSPDPTDTNVVQITSLGTDGTQTGFSLATTAGTWDPTIINNGDPSPWKPR